MKVVLTCEHASRLIPAPYRHYFLNLDALPQHRVYDAGACALAEELKKRLRAPLYKGSYSRLITDLNRSVSHPQCISRYLSSLNSREKQSLIRRYHQPYRMKVTRAIKKFRRRGTVLHLSIHSFTPRFKGVRRKTDIGILFDPKRRWEKTFAVRWQRNLRHLMPRMRVHLNRPYRGWTDGLTSTLRRHFRNTGYIGIELEVNQRHLKPNGRFPRSILDALVQSL